MCRGRRNRYRIAAPEAAISDSIEFVRSNDAYLRDVGGEYAVEIPLLGIPTRFESNAPLIPVLAQQWFGDWNRLHEQPALLSDDHATVRIVVHETTDRWAYKLEQEHRFFVHRGCFASCDPVRRYSLAVLPPQELADVQAFRYYLFEALTFGILTTLDRQPLHAAAVSRNGTTLLLTGSSGTGKSTLAYALGCAGFEVMTDDSVYLQTRPSLRAWGIPRHLHISDDARRFFPELERCANQLMANGKTKLVVDAAARGFTSRLPVAEQPVIVLLERARQTALEPVDASTLVPALTQQMEDGFVLFADSIAASVQGLAAGGGWRLRLGDSPLEAVELLSRLT